MAICFAGLHWQDDYRHWNGSIKNINYRKYLNNIKKKIYGYFENDYLIDTFICTQETPNFEGLLKTYQPVKYCVENQNHCYKKLGVLQLLIDYIEKSYKNYDIVLLTRFDIYIMREFTNDNIDLSKLNIVSILEHEYTCDDNLFIFPIKYLKPFKTFIENQLRSTNAANAIHFLKNELERHLSINYICNERRLVAELSFYKLHLFDDMQLILNRYLFTENVVYKSPQNNASILIDGNIIEFTKYITKPGGFCWAGYELEKDSTYYLSFEMYSNRDIEFDFIKLHQPVRFYKTDPILANTWIKINLVIKTKGVNDLLCLIFDSFNDSINILYKNLTCINTSRGFIIDHIKQPNTYLSDKCVFKKLDNDSFEFIKEQTENATSYLWCGYNINPNKSSIIMKFDISFITEVPNIEDNFFIKTHSPAEHYNEWLSQCKKDKFVHVEIPLSLHKTEQLIIFIMDTCLKPVHFIIKNVEMI